MQKHINIGRFFLVYMYRIFIRCIMRLMSVCACTMHVLTELTNEKEAQKKIMASLFSNREIVIILFAAIFFNDGGRNLF